MLRDVVATDLPIFFEHQLDPEATRMAAFPPREEWDVFLEHWNTKILANPTSCKQTVVWKDQVAGNVLSWSQEGLRLVGYWIGREFWGRGIATAALMEFLGHERTRPLHAFVVAHNVGSIRVLEKCGFVRTSTVTGDDGVDEVLYRLDPAARGAGG